VELEPLNSGTIEVGQGLRQHYELFGQGNRKAVCILNGVAMHTRSWYPYLQRLLPHFDVVLHDFLGQGQSSKDDVPYSMELFCNSFLSILDRLELDRVHLLGVSYGALVGVEFARSHQERLDSLTLSGGWMTREEFVILDLETSQAILNEASFKTWTMYLYSKIFGESFIRNVRSEMEEMGKKLQERYRGLEHCLVRLIETQFAFADRLAETTPEYGKIRTPTLVICGDHDMIIPRWVQRKTCDLIPGAQLEVARDCGHIVFLEQPDFFF
jgi:3-oxoadipate enol-lactonase